MGPLFGRVVEEEFTEEFLGSGDRRNTGSAAGPAHHATAMQAVFGANRERGKAGCAADRFGCALIDADVAIGHAFGIDGANAAQIGVHGEVGRL